VGDKPGVPPAEASGAKRGMWVRGMWVGVGDVGGCRCGACDGGPWAGIGQGSRWWS
jgi:hypothetical protein